MHFGSFSSLQEVAKTYQIVLREEAFLRPQPVAVDERFVQRLQFIRTHVAVKLSEAAICEFLIAPVLQEVWLPHSDLLTLWSHVPLGEEPPLQGVPDYFFARRSPLGLVPDQPYLVLMEAKKDDFEGGWGQCLAAMLAAQRLNKQTELTIYGCVTSGDVWQFGKLERQVFTQESTFFTIQDLSSLFAALNGLFMLARASPGCRGLRGQGLEVREKLWTRQSHLRNLV